MKKKSTLWNTEFQQSLGGHTPSTSTIMPTSRTTGRHPDSMDVYSHNPSQMTIGHINTCPYCHALHQESFKERPLYMYQEVYYAIL